VRLAAALAAALAVAAVPAPPSRVARTSPVLTPVADVPLPGPAVRFDYQSLDIGSDRLYIAHMGAGAIVVFNVRTRQVETTIAGMPGVTGVWAVPELHRLYASVSRLHHVAVIDDRSFQVIARVGRIGFPDGIAYAPDQQTSRATASSSSTRPPTRSRACRWTARPATRSSTRARAASWWRCRRGTRCT
jgi:hypothetical protein